MLFYQFNNTNRTNQNTGNFCEIKASSFFLRYFSVDYRSQNIAAERGPVTNLLMPRYVSLKATEANARRGPSLSHRIDWIFKKKGMPLEIYGEYDNWRRVRDAEGAGGWIHYSLLSGVRSIVVTSSMANLHRKSNKNSMVLARIEENYIADLGKCVKDWCEIDAGKYDGWVKKIDVWGVAPNEVR
jgi:SH3-like domain-containing protein